MAQTKFNNTQTNYPPLFFSGFQLANGTDATNDINIGVGKCRNSDDTEDIILAGALVKQLDVAWAVGTNAGMRASGAAIADAWYHIFVIKRPDTGVVDIAADTSATGANIAANTDAAYTKIRLISSILRESGAIRAFYNYGNRFFWPVAALDINGGVSTIAVPVTLAHVPTGRKSALSLSFGLGNCTIEVWDYDLGASATGWYMAGGNNVTVANNIVMCDASAQIYYRLNAGIVYAYTLGWEELRQV